MAKAQWNFVMDCVTRFGAKVELMCQNAGRSSNRYRRTMPVKSNSGVPLLGEGVAANRQSAESEAASHGEC